MLDYYLDLIQIFQIVQSMTYVSCFPHSLRIGG